MAVPVPPYQFPARSIVCFMDLRHASTPEPLSALQSPNRIELCPLSSPAALWPERRPRARSLLQSPRAKSCSEPLRLSGVAPDPGGEDWCLPSKLCRFIYFIRSLLWRARSPDLAGSDPATWRFEIDHEFIRCRRLHRQVGWSLTFENPVQVACGPTKGFDPIRTVGNETACYRECAIARHRPHPNDSRSAGCDLCSNPTPQGLSARLAALVGGAMHAGFGRHAGVLTLLFEEAANNGEKLHGAVRLGDVAIATRSACLLLVALHGVRAYGDHGCRLYSWIRFDLSDGLVAIENRQLDVHKNKIGSFRLCSCHTFDAINRLHRLVTGGIEKIA